MEGIRIGFDAKRAYFNRRGLGNYARNLLQGLFTHHPEAEYLLFSPPPKESLFEPEGNFLRISPSGIWSRRFPSAWRSLWMGREIKKHPVRIFHGLSNELPLDIDHARALTAVTVHDLIQCRYPKLYHWDERILYNLKYKQSARKADCVIATSRQTLEDLVQFWKIPAEKIRIVYQSCDPTFSQLPSPGRIPEIANQYRLPEQFLLSVGAIEERKNLLQVLQALEFGKIDIPLVVCGAKTAYYQTLQQFLSRHALQSRVFFLHSVSNQDLPVIYRLASGLVYPSRFEGFGIPVLEGMTSGIPVITSTRSCLPEIGGNACLYIDPDDTEAMIHAIRSILENEDLRKNMIREGFLRAMDFSMESTTGSLMNVYREMLEK